MPSYLGQRVAYGIPDPDNLFGAGNWTVTFTQSALAQVHAQIHHIAISGPPGSAMQMYLDTTFYDYVARGDINSFDPAQPMPIIPGQTLYFYWNSAINPVPKVTIFLQQTQ